MQKLLFRIFVLSLVFVVSLGIFIALKKENSLTRAIETTEMSDVSLPVVSVKNGEHEINFMYGYVKDTFPFGVREEITPVGIGGELEFYLYHYGNEISTVEYEISNRTEKIVLETGEGTIEAGDEEGKSKVKLDIEYNFSGDSLYGMKLILINNDGKKVYYYTTLKYLKEDRFKNNFQFVKRLEKAIFSKKDASFVKQFLESNDTMDNMSFHHVNIHSSYDLVSWGELAPVKVTETKISVLENNRNTTGFLLKYVAAVGKENRNFYFVTEYYRVNSFENSIFLLAYDRRVEEVFKPEKTSLSRKQLKFGIGDKNTDFFADSTKKYIGFVRERELWQYQTETNTLYKVFAFRKDDFSSDREILDRHKVKLLRVEQNGDLYFAVYGYMNRGVYEGRNGLVIYKFHEQDKRIEELVYLPADKFYKDLIHDVDRISYLSGDGFFYFTMEGRLYSYSLAKRKVEIVADKALNDIFLVLNDGRDIAWQEESGNREVKVLNLESRHFALIKKGEDEEHRLFAAIDNHMIYGVAAKKDIHKNKDGSILIPCKKIIISDSIGKTLKEYEKKDSYVVDVHIEKTVIHLSRMKKKDGKFSVTADDQILNNEFRKLEEISIIDRRTEKYLTEYYLKLPKNTELKEIPTAFLDVKNTVIISETTAKFPENLAPANRYYATLYGRVTNSSEKPSGMIRLADEGMGFVTDSHGNVIWERGNTKAFQMAEEIDVDYADEGDSEKEAAIRLFLTASGIYISDKELKTGKSIMEILSTQPEIRALNLTGVSLDEVLYYVSEGNPVIAMVDDRFVIITAYQPKSVTIMNVKTGEVEILSREEAAQLFEKAGNRFVSAIG